MRADHEILAFIGEQLGYHFADRSLLLQAVTHRSFANEATEGDQITHNERLEFLGDAVLGVVVSEMLMDAYPEVNEGELSRMRAALVNELDLARVARQRQLGEVLKLGKGEECSGGRNKTSLLADLLEALLGAIYLDGGIENARQVIHTALGDQVKAVGLRSARFDSKSRLQESMQQEGKPLPHYEVVLTTGPEHARQFTVSVCAEGQEIGRGVGKNKKEAEQNAARQALGKEPKPLKSSDLQEENLS